MQEKSENKDELKMLLSLFHCLLCSYKLTILIPVLRNCYISSLELSPHVDVATKTIILTFIIIITE